MPMSDSQLYSFKALLDQVWIRYQCLTFFKLIIFSAKVTCAFPLQKCVTNYQNLTVSNLWKNDNIFKIFDHIKVLKVTVVNRGLQPLHGWSLEITYTAWLPMEERAHRKTRLGGGDYQFRTSALPPSQERSLEMTYKCPSLKIFFT